MKEHILEHLVSSSFILFWIGFGIILSSWIVFAFKEKRLRDNLIVYKRQACIMFVLVGTGLLVSLISLAITIAAFLSI